MQNSNFTSPVFGFGGDSLLTFPDAEEWSFGLKHFRPERQFPNSHIDQTKRQIIVLLLLIDSKCSQGRQNRSASLGSLGGPGRYDRAQVLFFKTPPRLEAPPELYDYMRV